MALALLVTLAGWLPPAPWQSGARAATPPTVARDAPLPVAAFGRVVPNAVARTLGGGTLSILRAFSSPARTVCAPIDFNALGVAWTQHGAARGALSAVVRVAPRSVGTPAQAASARFGTRAVAADDQVAEGPNVQSIEYHPSRRATEMVWVGNARCARITLRFPAGALVSDVHAVFVNTLGNAWGGPEQGLTPPPPGDGGGPFAPATAAASTGRPDIITRAQWGAKQKYLNCFAGYSPRLKMAVIHHTDQTNGYTRAQAAGLVRAVYYYHTQVNGWCDIGYNFLVDRYGDIFEGRAGGMMLPVIPAAQMGFNTDSVAIAAIGNYQTAYPTRAMLSAIERLLTWRMDVGHVPPKARTWMMSWGGAGNRFKKGTWVRLNTISGHRDVNYTDCPGAHLYADLNAIRTVVNRSGLPKIYYPKQSPSTLFLGQGGTVTWRARASTTVRWTVTVYDPSGNAVWTWSQAGTSRMLASWNGLAADGVAEPPGTYTVVISARTGGRHARPARFALTIALPPPPSPSPSPSPTGGPSPPPSPSPSPFPSPSAPSPSPSA